MRDECRRITGLKQIEPANWWVQEVDEESDYAKSIVHYGCKGHIPQGKAIVGVGLNPRSGLPSINRKSSYRSCKDYNCPNNTVHHADPLEQTRLRTIKAAEQLSFTEHINQYIQLDLFIDRVSKSSDVTGNSSQTNLNQIRNILLNDRDILMIILAWGAAGKSLLTRNPDYASQMYEILKQVERSKLYWWAPTSGVQATARISKELVRVHGRVDAVPYDMVARYCGLS